MLLLASIVIAVVVAAVGYEWVVRRPWAVAMRRSTAMAAGAAIACIGLGVASALWGVFAR